jgi:hypothetical protein
MQKRDLPYLVLGLLVTTVYSCRSLTDNNGLMTVEPEVAGTTIATTPEKEPTERPPTRAAPLPSVAPPDEVPPEPTAQAWQLLGNERGGLAIPIPAGWVDLSDQVALPAIANRLGINLLLAADSERTGRSLLAGKPFEDGATVTVLLASSLPGAADLGTSVAAWLAGLEPGIVPETSPTAIQSADGVPGVSLDVSGGPVGLSLAGQSPLRTRVAVFAPPPQPGSPQTWLVFLLSATADRWDESSARFDKALRNARIGSARTGAPSQGGIVARGELEVDRDLVTATIEEGTTDAWTFSSVANRYASLFLRPDETDLDLTVTVLGPNRQTLATADNAFAGGTEVITDLLLDQSGVYVVEVDSFFKESGRYTLSLVLSDIPQYSGGGPIAFGQAIEGDLPPNGQQYWVFSGAAGQRVSIVLEPGPTTFDAVLDLYGPDGRSLVARDEGFSGDPEVISGFDLPATGEYAIQVRSFSQQGGTYTLSLDETGQEVANFFDAGDIAYGETKQQTLQRQEAHAWFFEGKAGDQLSIRANPLAANLDLDVWLLDPQAARIATADDGVKGEPENITAALTADGQYIILVRDFNGEAGDYILALSADPIATPETGGTVSYGDSVMGQIAPNGSVVWSFNAQGGDLIGITVVPEESGSDLVLLLRGPDGSAVPVDSTPAGQPETVTAFAIPTSGLWEIVVQEFFGEATGYRLSLERAD